MQSKQLAVYPLATFPEDLMCIPNAGPAISSRTSTSVQRSGSALSEHAIDG